MSVDGGENTRQRRPSRESRTSSPRSGDRPCPAAELPAQADARRLLEELKVQQIELEMQNEVLRAVRAELELGLERYTELFDFAPLGYAVLDSDGAIQELNHAGARMLGGPRSHLVGQGFEHFVAECERRHWRTLLQGALQGSGTHGGELTSTSSRGLARRLRLTAARLARTEPAVIVAFEDVTEHEEHEKRLRGNDEFLTTLSRELRDPLAPIRNSLYVLGRTLGDNEQARRSHAIIERQVTRLAQLVDDLLDVSRLAGGTLEVKREHVDLGELVRRTIDQERTNFEMSGIRLEEHLATKQIWVRADPARVVQMVANLLGNAEKFTPRGGTVVVTLECKAEVAVLRVRDTGTGIAPAFLPHVFQPFVRAPQDAARSRGGLGLGLAMTKGIVELLGGTVEISSGGLGHGTEVLMRLPVVKRAPEVVPASKQPITRSRRVLVIEDQRDAAQSLKDVLALSGHEVEVCHDGPAGLDWARRYRPEIVICDIGLPGMDGYAVARAFAADDVLRSAYLIALTGYAGPEDIQHAREAGFRQHVAKPPNLERLVQLIDEAPAKPAGPRRLLRRV